MFWYFQVSHPQSFLCYLIPIILLTGIYNAPKFFKELGEDLKAHSQMVIISYVSAFAIYASFALAGLGPFQG